MHACDILLECTGTTRVLLCEQERVVVGFVGEKYAEIG